jgi:hypothetical protein
MFERLRLVGETVDHYYTLPVTQAELGDARHRDVAGGNFSQSLTRTVNDWHQSDAKLPTNRDGADPVPRRRIDHDPSSSQLAVRGHFRPARGRGLALDQFLSVTQPL